MSKKIKIQVKDVREMEFQLSEDGNIGDYFSLNDLEEVSFDLIKSNLMAKEQALLNEMWDSKKHELLMNSSEYKSLEEKNNELMKDLEVQTNKIESSKNLEINELKSKIEILESSINSKVAEAVSKSEIKIVEIEKENELRLNSLQNELKSKDASTELKIMKEVQAKAEELNEIIEDKENQIRQLERSRTFNNVKDLGENLENHIASLASKHLSLDGIRHVKANDVIDGTKPDFIFEVVDLEDGSKITSATIEAKSESLNAKTKTKNVQHLEKLDSDRKKNNTEYAILVTELEKEDDFLFKKVGDYKNMYMVRPEYYASLMLLIYNLEMKTKNVNKLEINLKEKQEILDDFEKFKADILEGVITKLNKKNEDINKEADKIINSANNIISSNNTIARHIATLENKLGESSIRKVLKNLKE